jgi:hypothetical protein
VHSNDMIPVTGEHHCRTVLCHPDDLLRREEIPHRALLHTLIDDFDLLLTKA